MLIINDSLNKRFCKKVFGFSISLFKKCYVHNIFTINFHNIVNWNYSNIFYTFNIFIGSLPHTQPNPFPFSFSFLFFLPFFLSHKSQPCTFCNAPAQFKSKEKRGGGGGSDILRSHMCDPTYLTPLNHTSHKYPYSLGRPLICFFPFFFFFHTTNTPLYHSLINFHDTHSIAPHPPLFSCKDHRKTP